MKQSFLLQSCRKRFKNPEKTLRNLKSFLITPFHSTIRPARFFPTPLILVYAPFPFLPPQLHINNPAKTTLQICVKGKRTSKTTQDKDFNQFEVSINF